MKAYLIVLMVLLTPVRVFSQCEESLKQAELAFGDNFLVEPHAFQGMLAPGDSLAFEALWLEGNTYRISTSNTNKQHVRMLVFDKNNNPIFDGSEFSYPVKWDFFVEHSLEVRCVIKVEAHEPTCVAVLTGFKK